MTQTAHDPRCINWDCYLRKDCARFVKQSWSNEALFSGQPKGGDCDDFKELHQSWGQGHEPND